MSCSLSVSSGKENTFQEMSLSLSSSALADLTNLRICLEEGVHAEIELHGGRGVQISSFFEHSVS